MSELERDQPYRVPPIYIDLYTGGRLIGEPAREAAIEAMERGGFPTDIHLISELVEGDQELPKFSKSNPRKYDGWQRQDFINDGRWLVSQVVNLTVRKGQRASRLDLIANPATIVSPGRFSSMGEYQEAVDQEKIEWHKAFEDWDKIDLLTHLRKISQEEDSVATRAIIARRIKEGQKEPGYETMQTIMPAMEARELIGYVVPQNMAKRDYQEWGYLFYLANRRLPFRSDLYALSPQGLAPSSSSIDLVYEGASDDFNESIALMVQNRQAIKLAEINGEFRNGLLMELASGCESPEEFIRRAGRYKIIDQLLANDSKATSIALSRYDVVGKDFIAYLRSQDRRLKDWMVESSARINLTYPEIFPDGSFHKSLEVQSTLTSYFANKSKIDYEELAKHTEPRPPQRKKPLDETELKIIELIMDGKDLLSISGAVLHNRDEKKLRKDYMSPLKRQLRARNHAHMIRQATSSGLIDHRLVEGPELILKQKEILELISYGARQKEIAKILGISPQAVTAQVRKMKIALSAKNEAQLVAQGYRTGNLSLGRNGSYLPHIEAVG